MIVRVITEIKKKRQKVPTDISISACTFFLSTFDVRYRNFLIFFPVSLISLIVLFLFSLRDI